MQKFVRSRLALVALLSVAAVAAASTSAIGATAGKKDSGVAYVAITHQVGNTLYAAGDSNDKLLGPGAVTYTIKAGAGAKAGTVKETGSVTVWGVNGSLTGKVKGTEITSASGSVTESGTIALTKGTGNEKGHSYVGTFTGTGKTPTGPFVFHTKALYK
jgi:hypothetical protein